MQNSIRLVVILTFLLFSKSGICQDWKEAIIELDSTRSYTPELLLKTIKEQRDINFSYANAIFEPINSIALTRQQYTVEELVSLLASAYTLDATYKRKKKILLYPADESASFQYFGYIKDKHSKSSIANAYIYHRYGSEYSDDNGYFSLTLPNSKSTYAIPIIVNAIGYKIDTLQLQSQSPVILNLEHSNILDTFFISPSTSALLVPQSGKIIDVTNNGLNYASLSGEHDIIAGLRDFGAYDVGDEGRHGLSIRGGSTDQNLILIDDIPVFEFSHLGGQQSIFISELVQSASLLTSGIPAKYGGKLASVLDINLKQAALDSAEHTLKLGFDAVSGTVNRPIIKDKVGLIASGRLSLWNLVSEPVLKSIRELDDTDQKFYDLYAKVTAQLKPGHQLSGLLYRGGDKFSLEKSNRQSQGLDRTYVDIGWGNTIYGVQYSGIPTDKIALKLSANSSEYTFSSRGAFELFQNKPEPDLLSFDVYSRSSNLSNNLKGEATYYSDVIGKTLLGFQLSKYRFSPNLFQSSIYRDPTITNNQLDLVEYESSEQVAFLQNKKQLSTELTLNSGLRFVNLKGNDFQFSALEPRLSLQYQTKNTYIGLQYSVIHQNVHLLVNPGIGLPSDLWYPANNAFGPQRQVELSIETYFNLAKGQTFGLSLYNKQLSNVIEYSNPQDLFYNILNAEAIPPTLATRLDLESNIYQGNGSARGLETSYRMQTSKFVGWVNYSYLDARRQFAEINDGQEFPSRTDRKHNLSLGASYLLSKNKSILVKWAYGSGTPFTLNTSEILISPGDTIFIQNVAKRNNFRMPAYHHLDIRYTWRTSIKSGKLEISAGIYNVYNRRNPLYVYLKDEPGLNRKKLVIVSILPILPSFKMLYEF